MARFQLHGGMIPRSVKRMFDQRHDAREEIVATALLRIRGAEVAVEIVNLSRSGAMVRFAGDARIGEAVQLQRVDRKAIGGEVRWLRDGRMGIYFETPLD